MDGLHRPLRIDRQEEPSLPVVVHERRRPLAEDLEPVEHGVRRVVLPAEYEGVAHEVLVRPEQRRISEIPPSYRTVAHRVVVREGSTTWRRVHIPRRCVD